MGVSRRNSSTKTPSKAAARPVILWGLDPLQDDVRFHRHALQVLRPFALAFGLKIQPVVVVGPFQLREWALGGREGDLDLRGDYPLLRSWIEQRMRSLISSKERNLVLDVLLLKTPQSHDDSLSDRVETLCTHARKVKAPFVALHSHGRHGLKRLFMGSFAETCVLHADVPILVMNPSAQPAKRIARILFPTDLSAASRQVFERTLHLAKQLKAELKLVHCLHVAGLSVFYASRQSKVQLQKEQRAEELRVKRAAALLLRRAKAKGVKSSFSILRSKGRFDPAEMLLEAASRSPVQLIAMAARSNSARAALIGATSRKLARSSRCPVLLLRR
ncbi:MAG: universal stress protein [Bdellovibrionota bacterium]|nr:MAG: universal stress protein [Bdellovibrionota bacterium]